MADHDLDNINSSTGEQKQITFNQPIKIQENNKDLKYNESIIIKAEQPIQIKNHKFTDNNSEITPIKNSHLNRSSFSEQTRDEFYNINNQKLRREANSISEVSNFTNLQGIGVYLTQHNSKCYTSQIIGDISNPLMITKKRQDTPYPKGYDANPYLNNKVTSVLYDNIKLDTFENNSDKKTINNSLSLKNDLMEICDEEIIGKDEKEKETEDKVSCRKSLARLSLNNDDEIFKDDIDRIVIKSEKIKQMTIEKYNKMELELKEAKRKIKALKEQNEILEFKCNEYMKNEDRESEKEMFELIEKWLCTESIKEIELNREKERNFVLENRTNELKLKNEQLEKELYETNRQQNKIKDIDVIKEEKSEKIIKKLLPKKNKIQKKALKVNPVAKMRRGN